MNSATLDKLEAWQAAIIAYGDGPSPPTTGLTNHRLGCHWICDQFRSSDLTYMAALRPPVIKIVNPSPDRVAEAFARIDPAGHVALRYHPISEQQAELAADPAGLGHQHAQYWIGQINGPYSRFDRDRLYVMGINEPTIHNGDQARGVATYTEAFLRELQPHRIRAYVFNFSVGWPREEAGRIIWNEFLHLESLINDTNSFGCVHEYWYPTVMSGWNSYGNRVSRCPMKIKFVIGECAYTKQLINPPVGQPWGWDGNLSADSYAAMLWEYADKVDPGKVFAVLPFTTSFGGAEWQSKDTAKAHNHILARKHAYIWPDPWPAFDDEPPPVTDKFRLLWPKMPRISQYFGGTHSGLDIPMPVGTPLYAMWDGIVAWSDVDTAANGGYGEYVRVSYPELGFDSLSGHMSLRDVHNGDIVRRGQRIGTSGNTGNSTGPHLHLEIRLKLPNKAYRPGVSAFSRGQVDPMAVKWALANLYGFDEA